MYENNKDIGWKKKNSSSNGSYDDSLIKNQINILDNKIDEEIEEVNSQLAHNENLNEEMFVNVKKYGAKGDGVTDDSEAFRRAFSKGNQIIIPPGKYLVSNIKITEPKVIKGLTSSFAWREQN